MSEAQIRWARHVALKRDVQAIITDWRRVDEQFTAVEHERVLQLTALFESYRGRLSDRTVNSLCRHIDRHGSYIYYRHQPPLLQTYTVADFLAELAKPDGGKIGLLRGIGKATIIEIRSAMLPPETAQP